MPQAAQQIDLSSLIAALNALTQTVGTNGRTLATLLNTGIVVVPEPVEYFHIAGAGTFEILGTSGTLLSLNINQVGTAGGGTIYDAAGTVSVAGSLEVAVMTFGTVAPVMVPLGPSERGFGLNNGLVVVTTGDGDITLGIQS